MHKIVEPYTRVEERIHDTPNLLDIDGTSNIGGVIVAPRGERLAYIAGPKQFLETYTVDGTIPRNADRTLVNAYYLSFSSGLVLARAMNTTAVNGLWFKTKSRKERKMLMNISNESLWGLKFGDKYYWHNGSNKSASDFIETIKQLVDGDNNPVYSKDIVTKVTGAIANGVRCSSLTDLATKIEKELYANSTTKDQAYTVIYSKTVGGLIFTPDISTDLFDPASTEQLNLLIGMTVDLPVAGNERVGLESHSINYKDGVALTESESITFTFTDGGKKDKSNWAFVFGSMAYYHGAVDKSKYADYSLKYCESLDDVADSISGIKGMTANRVEGEDKINIVFSKGNRLYVATEESKLNVGFTSITQGDVTSTYGEMTGSDGMLFAVYPKDPQGENVYKLVVTPAEGDLFNIALTTDKGTENYTVSLNVDAKDASGSNAFIENLNSLSTGFTFVTNPELDENKLAENTPKLTQVFSFGNSGLDLSASKKVNCLIDALYELDDQEQYDIEYIAPLGLVDLQFIKNYQLVGNKNDWFAPVDIPWDKTNANSIMSYFLNVTSTSNTQAMGPFDKNTGLTGWMNYIACTTLYYTKVMSNKAAGKEFAPVFDLTNGVLNFSNPCYMLGEKERTQLLNFRCPINFLTYNQRSTSYYLNDNRTFQSETNVVSEEQNRRMVNKIKKDCKRQLDRFKGRFNTESTRSDVRSLLGIYFTDNIMNTVTEFKPERYVIICDESNNTPDLIAANKLAVTVQIRLYGAIKFINVLVDVFPLNVDFNN